MECLNCERERGYRLRLEQMSNIREPIGSARTGNRNQVCHCSVCGDIVRSLVKTNFPGKGIAQTEVRMGQFYSRGGVV